MRTRILAVVAAVFLVFGGAAIAYASIPGPDGVIYGCYKTGNPNPGSLIVVDSGASCPSGYVALNWNQTGPQGPAGISGWETIRGGGVPANLTGGGYYTATQALHCPTGKFAVGGGYHYDNSGFSNPAGVQPVQNGFNNFIGGTGALPTAWTTRVEAVSNGTLYVDVICANA